LVDPEQLQAQGVSLEQVVETTGNALWVSSLSFLEASSPGTGGFIDTPNQRLGIWHVLPISSPEDLAKVPVDGTSLTLGEVSQIVEDHQPLIGDAIVNDDPNLLLVIEKLPSTNTLEVTKGVESAIAALRPGFSEIEFDTTLFRPATFIEVAIANITRTMVLGALLAILVFGVLFHGWRTALISLVAILTSLVAALFVLHLQGATLNAMVLSGFVIALGIIIDDAVVDVDNIAREHYPGSFIPDAQYSLLRHAGYIAGYHSYFLHGRYFRCRVPANCPLLCYGDSRFDGCGNDRNTRIKYAGFI
jgi:multidrug efflux pump subunit AcrB